MPADAGQVLRQGGTGRPLLEADGVAQVEGLSGGEAVGATQDAALPGEPGEADGAGDGLGVEACRADMV
jgi:hypothetical protein